MHQLSHSIFSCWAVDWPSLRDLEALMGSGRRKVWAMTLARGPPAARASHAAAASPGQNHHHGVEVNGTICQALQHELFICQVDGIGWVGGRWWRERERSRGGEVGGAHSLTISFLCFISFTSTTVANCSRACTA